MERLRLHHCVSALTNSPCSHTAFRQGRDAGGKDVPEELREQFVAISTIPTTTGECEGAVWTAKKVAICLSIHRPPCQSLNDNFILESLF